MNCKDCNDEMVKAYICLDGVWVACWVCECPVPDEVIDEGEDGDIFYEGELVAE